MLGHDGDLVSVHAQDLPLQVDQLSLTHLHVVSSLQVVFSLFACRQDQDQKHSSWCCSVRPLLEPEGLSDLFLPPSRSPDSVTTSRSSPSG